MRLSIMNLEGLDEVEGELADQGVSAAEAEAAVATEFVDGPEAAMAEVETEAGDIEGLLEDGEKAEAVADKVGEMKDGLEKVVAEDGGLTESTAEVVTVALEALRISIGMGPMNKSLVPSFESFRDKTTAAESTHLIMESFTDTIKRIWAALVNMVSVIKEKIKAFFAGMFDAAERTRQRAVKLAAVAKSRSGSKPAADEKVTINSYFLNVDGNLVEGAAFVNKFKEHIKTTQVGADNQILASYKEIGQNLTKMIPMDDDNPEKIELIKKTLKEANKVNDDRAHKPFVFGQILLVITEADTAFEGFKASILALRMPENAKEVAAKSEVKPLSADEAYTLCNTMSDHLAGYKALGEVKKKADAILDGVMAAAKAGAAAASKAKDENGAKNATELRKAASRMMSNLNVLLVATRRYDIAISNSTLEYVAGSLKGAKGKGDGKPENLLPAPDKQSKSETLALK